MSSENLRKIGERLKKVRKTKGVNQIELANKFGVGRHSILNYESGNRYPNVDFLVFFINEFNVNANWLLMGEGEMFSSSENTVPKESTHIEDNFITNYYGKNIDEGDRFLIKRILQAMKIPFKRIQLNSYLIAVDKDYKKVILGDLTESNAKAK